VEIDHLSILQVNIQVQRRVSAVGCGFRRKSATDSDLKSATDSDLKPAIRSDGSRPPIPI
jgi:hypothetical protein